MDNRKHETIAHSFLHIVSPLCLPLPFLPCRGDGSQLEARDGDADTPLIVAVSNVPCVAIVRMLIERGADVTARGDKEQTALLRLCRERSY